MIGLRELGGSGVMVPEIGFGTWRYRGGVEPLIRAIELGANLIDTAEVYRTEPVVGKALEGRREGVFLATKVSGDHLRYDQVLRAVEDSLERLGTRVIDLYQVHRHDPGTPDEETVRALDDLVHAGKVRYLGVSNYAGWEIAHNQWIARSGGHTPFISIQSEYNLLNRSLERDVIPAARKFGLGLVPFYPLASGLLTGKYRRGEPVPAGTRLSPGVDAISGYALTDENFDRVERLEAFAGDRGHTILELALSWLASLDCVGSIIAGATRPEQVKANAAAVSWRLTPEELVEVDRLTAR